MKSSRHPVPPHFTSPARHFPARPGVGALCSAPVATFLDFMKTIESQKKEGVAFEDLLNGMYRMDKAPSPNTACQAQRRIKMVKQTIHIR